MHAGSGVCIMAQESNKYYKRLYKLLNEKISAKKITEENYQRIRKEILERDNEIINLIKNTPIELLKKVHEWAKDKDYYIDTTDELEATKTLSKLSLNKEEISYEEAFTFYKFMNSMEEEKFENEIINKIKKTPLEN